MYLNNRLSHAIFLVFFLMNFSVLLAQRNNTKHMRIKKIEFKQSEYKSNKWQLTRYSISEFDKKGNPLRNMEYGLDSSFKSNESTVYNANYDPIEYTIFDQNGNQIRKTRTFYNFLNQKIEERVYGVNDILLSSTVFEYDQFGHKILEIEKNESNVELSQTRYEYNKFGSLVLKQIYRNGQCVYEKKYVYQYY
ncbi:MAG: hypothetical protein RLZZ30_279 [Bacteroidota bacterium]|jgi:hypothetical protein